MISGAEYDFAEQQKRGSDVWSGSRTDGEVCPRRRQLSPEAAIAPLLHDASMM
jgi:hypothetical protein